jgi:hypothetical protein
MAQDIVGSAFDLPERFLIMEARKPPFEVVGFVDRYVYVVDRIRGTAGYRWQFFVNDNFDDDDWAHWDGDSDGGKCPF